MYFDWWLPKSPLDAGLRAGVAAVAAALFILTPAQVGAPLMQIVANWLRFLVGCGMIGQTLFYLCFGVYLWREER